MQEIIFDNKLSKIKYKKFTLIKKEFSRSQQFQNR